MFTKVFPHKLSNLSLHWDLLRLICIPQSHSEVYLSSTVDEIFTLNGAPVSLHCHHMTLLHQNLLNTGPLQDLNPWTG